MNDTTAPPRRQRQTWQENILRWAEHMPIHEAAAKAGVSLTEVAGLRDTDVLFDAALRRAQERGGIPEGPRAVVLDQLRQGALLREAAEEAGIAVATLKSWRRQDADFDAAVLTAVVEGRGRLGRVRPLARLRCPGMCASTTGYDFGCRKDACAGAKAAQMRALRAALPRGAR